MINRRQMIKISALGIASTAVPAAHAMSDLTMRYNTGNAVEPNGSSHPFDLFDNTANMDLAANGDALTWTDRRGRVRKSFAGMELDFGAAQASREQVFQDFLLSSGYIDIGDYGPLLQISLRNQVFRKGGEYYRIAAPVELPYTTTGDWESEKGFFVQAGDAVLRQDLAEETGAELVSMDGRKIAYTLRDSVNVKDGRFGAIGDGQYHPLSERYSSINAAKVKYPFVKSLLQSIDWAACQKAVMTGKRVRAPSSVYVWTDSLRMTSSQRFDCDGVGSWNHLDPSILKTNDCGTHFIMYGVGEKEHTLWGVTDMRTAGGVVSNPDSINSLDTKYELSNFHNDDAADGVESTLRKFSCAIYVEPGSQRGGISNFRVHPNFDGLNGYNDQMTTGLGDNWDVGIFADNCPFFSMDNVQCVGYWRIRGVLVGCVSRDGVQGANYFTNINRCEIQAGLEIRGGDQSKVLATTANTIDVPWADNHPYRNSGTVNTPRGNFTYTSTSKVAGTLNGTVLRFNGVSPNPVTTGLANGPVRISSGSGVGGMTITNSIITGLDHSSMLLASNPLIGHGVSTALMISGTLRQPWFLNCYIQTREDVIAHFHACDDIRFSMGQLEANDFRLVPGGPFSPVHGGRVIASPQDIANPIVTASGDTSLSLYQLHCAPYVDMFPKVARTANSKFTSSTGLFNPRKLQYPDLQMPDSDHLDVNPLLTQNLRHNLAPGMHQLTRDSAGNSLLTVSEASGDVVVVKGRFTIAAGQLSFPNSSPAYLNAGTGREFYFRQALEEMWQITAAGSWVPGTDAKPNIGSAIKRVNNSFFAVAPTVSSDRNLKKTRGLLNDAELAVCEAILPQVYQLLDMVEAKGEDEARLHFGYIAQDVQQAFIDQNLDPARYALWGEDAVTKKVKKMVKVERQKVEKVMEPREFIEIREGQAVLVSYAEEVHAPVSQQVPLVNEDGSPALDENGQARYATIPVMEEVEEEVEVEVPDGFRQSLRYTELQVLKEAYLCTLISKQGMLIEALEQRIHALER